MNVIRSCSSQWLPEQEPDLSLREVWMVIHSLPHESPNDIHVGGTDQDVTRGSVAQRLTATE